MNTYTPPTSDEIRALLKKRGLTGSAAAKLCGVNPRTVRRWTGGDISMPYAVWRLLLDERKPIPENGAVVWQDGKDAIVAQVRTWYEDDGRQTRTVWHETLHRFGTYWFRSVESNDEWQQLFGHYGGKGEAMSQDRLPGCHVQSADDLPEETT